MPSRYPSGPDVSSYFPEIQRPLADEADIIRRLPAAFDKSCKCGEQMQFTTGNIYATRHKPFATFQCPMCSKRLFVIEAPITPLLVWSNAVPSATVISFSGFIEKKIAERAHKREIHALRYGLKGYMFRIFRYVLSRRHS